MNPIASNRLSQFFHGDIKLPEELTEPALHNWISQLPLANVDAAGVTIHSMLRTANMTDNLSCDERIRIIEQIRPLALSLVENVSEKHLPDTSFFPLPLVQRRHIQRNVEVCLELVGAYRRVMTSGGFFSEKVMGDTSRALIIYRALQACSQALLRSLESYEYPPEGYWREVYGFYRFAEGHHLQHLRLPMMEIEEATVDNQFKQMLLLALSGHQRHRPDEIRRFYAALTLIAKDSEIGNEPRQGKETALFCFDMDSDQAPRFVKAAKSITEGDRYFLFTWKMANKARQDFANFVYRYPDKLKLNSDEFLRLLKTLSTLGKRQFARKPDLGMREFVVGLPHLLTMLSEEVPLSGIVEPEPGQTNTQQSGVEESEAVVIEYPVSAPSDIWHQETSGFFANQTQNASQTELANDFVESKSGKLPGWLLNSSAGGCCILWLNRQVAAARVGELIGIYQEDQSMHVGVIRWLHQNASLELAIGVDLLSPLVEVVNIGAGSAEDSMQRGLYLSTHDKLRQPTSLLVAPGMFKAKDSVVLSHKDARHAYRLDTLLESTLSFQLFSLLGLDVRLPS